MASSASAEDFGKAAALQTSLPDFPSQWLWAEAQKSAFQKCYKRFLDYEVNLGSTKFSKHPRNVHLSLFISHLLNEETKTQRV